MSGKSDEKKIITNIYIIATLDGYNVTTIVFFFFENCGDIGYRCYNYLVDNIIRIL